MVYFLRDIYQSDAKALLQHQRNIRHFLFYAIIKQQEADGGFSIPYPILFISCQLV